MGHLTPIMPLSGLDFRYKICDLQSQTSGVTTYEVRWLEIAILH